MQLLSIIATSVLLGVQPPINDEVPVDWSGHSSVQGSIVFAQAAPPSSPPAPNQPAPAPLPQGSSPVTPKPGPGTTSAGHTDPWVEFLSRFAPVLAALVAAALGFFVSQHTERKAWVRRKTEQLRESQLEKLIQCNRSVHEILSSFDSSVTKLRQLKEKSLAGESEKRVSRAEMVALIRSWRAELAKSARDLEIFQMDFHLLRITAASRNAIAGIIDQVKRTIELLRAHEREEGEVPINTIEEVQQVIKGISDSYALLALDGLGG